MNCLNCLDNSYHPMGQLIDSLGICTGCNTHKEKNTINWYDKYDCGIRWTNDPNLIIGKHDPHPNQDGHEWISEKILSFIKNKNYLY